MKNNDIKINTKTLKAYRQLLNKTQKDMAELLGIGLTSYNQKENGKKPFTLSEARIIADHFNESIENIFFTNKVNFVNTNEGTLEG